MHPINCRCVVCMVDRSSFGTADAKALRDSVSDERVARVRVLARAKEIDMAEQDHPAEANVCDPHHFVWTWPIEGGSGSVGVCDLCRAITTAERDARLVAEGLAVAEYLLRQVVDYWDGRPTERHGHHIEADLRDVLRAITPATEDGAA